MTKSEFKLDNPVLFSLSESHEKFSVDFDGVKFYHPDYCPFGGFETSEDISKQIAEYATLVDNFFIVGERPELPAGLKVKKELICLQMISHERINADGEENIVALTSEYADLLFQLVNLVQPGYFKRKTALLGNYFGIFRNGELVSVAAERMTMNDAVEVSAIVTHPAHTRQGHAKQLIEHTVNQIFNQGKTPYLHVVENNTATIKLYEKLGFATRRKISFWNITKYRSQTIVDL